MSPGNVVRKPLSMAEQRVKGVGLNSAVWRTSRQSGSVLQYSSLLHTILVGIPECGLKALPGKRMDHKLFWFIWPRSFYWLSCTWNYMFGSALSIFRMWRKFFPNMSIYPALQNFPMENMLLFVRLGKMRQSRSFGGIFMLSFSSCYDCIGDQLVCFT